MKDSAAVRKLYPLLMVVIKGARTVGHLKLLVNEQTLPSIMGKMLAADWKQWAVGRPLLLRLVVTGVRTQTELSSYLCAASFAILNDEMNNIFGYMKRRCCEGSFFLSPKCSSAGEAKVSHFLSPLP